MKNIVWRNEQNKISVTHIIDDSVDVEKEKEKLEALPEYAGYTFIAYNVAIPETRDYRDAWDWITNDPVIDINMEKAREIKMKELRIMRNEELAKLDLKFIKAQEKSLSEDNAEELSEIVQKKQELRDLPQNVDLSPLNDVQSLKAFIPDILGKDNAA